MCVCVCVCVCVLHFIVNVLIKGRLPPGASVDLFKGTVEVHKEEKETFPNMMLVKKKVMALSLNSLPKLHNG